MSSRDELENKDAPIKPVQEEGVPGTPTTNEKRKHATSDGEVVDDNQSRTSAKKQKAGTGKPEGTASGSKTGNEEGMDEFEKKSGNGHDGTESSTKQRVRESTGKKSDEELLDSRDDRQAADPGANDDESREASRDEDPGKKSSQQQENEMMSSDEEDNQSGKNTLSSEEDELSDGSASSSEAYADSQPFYRRIRSEKQGLLRSTRELGSGEGAHGTVWDVHTADETLVVKSIRYESSVGDASERKAEKRRFLREVKAMIMCRKHRHVVQYICSYKLSNRLDETFNIVMMPRAHCSLDALLVANLKGQAADSRRTVLNRAPGCLIRALRFIHEKHVCHNDLKTANVLVHESKVLIADFGLSVFLSNFSGSSEANTDQEDDSESIACDVQSLGVILLQIAGFISEDSLDSYNSSGGDRGPYYLRMIAYLWRICGENPVPERSSFASMLCDIVFLLLEPHKKKVITMNQLVDFVSSQDRYGAIVSDSCDNCRKAWANNDKSRSTAATFAVFKDTEGPGRDVGISEADLDPGNFRGQESRVSLWEKVKRNVLKSHVMDSENESSGDDGVSTDNTYSKTERETRTCEGGK